MAAALYRCTCYKYTYTRKRLHRTGDWSPHSNTHCAQVGPERLGHRWTVPASVDTGV